MGKSRIMKIKNKQCKANHTETPVSYFSAKNFQRKQSNEFTETLVSCFSARNFLGIYFLKKETIK